MGVDHLRYNMADDCDLNGDGEFNGGDVIAFWQQCAGDCSIADVLTFVRGCR